MIPQGGIPADVREAHAEQGLLRAHFREEGDLRAGGEAVEHLARAAAEVLQRSVINGGVVVLRGKRDVAHVGLVFADHRLKISQGGGDFVCGRHQRAGGSRRGRRFVRHRGGFFRRGGDLACGEWRSGAQP